MVKTQLPPFGNVPKGFYINSARVNPQTFDITELNKRDHMLENSMPFLYGLIESILSHHQDAQVLGAAVRRSRREKKKTLMDKSLPALLPLKDWESSKNREKSRRRDSSIDSSNVGNPVDEERQSLDSEEESLNQLDATPVDDPDECDLGPSTLGQDNEYIQSWSGDVYQKSKDNTKNLKLQSVSVSLVYVAGEPYYSEWTLNELVDHVAGNSNNLFNGCEHM